jgi:hypothetical protein
MQCRGGYAEVNAEVRGGKCNVAEGMDLKVLRVPPLLRVSTASLHSLKRYPLDLPV